MTATTVCPLCSEKLTVRPAVGTDGIESLTFTPLKPNAGSTAIWNSCSKPSVRPPLAGVRDTRLGTIKL